MGADAAEGAGAASRRAVAWTFLGLGLCAGRDCEEASVSADWIAGSANSGKPFSRK
jgi:hypothetical protein